MFSIPVKDRRTFLAFAFAFVGAFASTAMADEMPGSADAFVNAVGMDTHFNYGGTPYVLAYESERDALIELGVKHIRDGSPTKDVAYLQRLRELCNRGIKHGDGLSIHTTDAQIRESLATFDPACVDFVEPANEYDNATAYGAKDANWASELVASQRLIYATMKSDPHFSDITVLGPALANSSLFASLGNIEAYMDAGNLHASFCDNYSKPTGYRHLALDQARLAVPTKPVWTTETQYSDNANRPCYLPDDVIAKYVPRTIAQRWLAGQPRTYWYEFSDQPTDASFGKVGFVDENGRPKPQYRALQSLLHELSDPGPSYRAAPFAYRIENTSSELGHALLAKRNGHYQLLLWLEVSSWNKKDHVEVTGSRKMVTVNIPNTIGHARLATYESNWTFGHTSVPIRGNTLEIPVGDAVEILDLST